MERINYEYWEHAAETKFNRVERQVLRKVLNGGISVLGVVEIAICLTKSRGETLEHLIMSPITKPDMVSLYQECLAEQNGNAIILRQALNKLYDNLPKMEPTPTTRERR